MTGNEDTTDIETIDDTDTKDILLEQNKACEDILLEQSKTCEDVQIITDQIDNQKLDSSIEKNGVGDDSSIEKVDYDNDKENSNVLHVPPRTKAIIHSPVEKPRCQKHSTSNQAASDDVMKVECEACFSLITDPRTTIPQIFGAMREWLPGSQKKMNVLVEEILKRGAHIDDMDGLEGNTMLHYACKSASEGMGCSEMAKQLVKDLLDKRANYKLRSRWTDMLPLHYAAYFNCPEILEILLGASSNADIDARSKEYEQGTSLHMAASGLCYDAAKFLIARGADPTLINNKYKTPYECIAEGTKQNMRQTPESVEQLRALLKNAKSAVAAEVLKEIGISLGDWVLVGGEKTGTLMFCGKTDFASGVWCGIELHDKTGKNDGSVAGVTYFKAKSGHGMFAPPSKLAILEKNRRPSLGNGQDSQKLKLRVNDRVSVIGFKLGTIRFIGKVKYSGGTWIGVELDKPYGKCNGTIDNVKYFICKPQHGVIVTPDKVKRSDKPAPKKEPRSPMSPRMSSRMVGSPGTVTSLDSNRSPVCTFPMRATPIKGARSTPTVVTSPTLPRSGVRASPGIVRSNSGSRPGSRGLSPTRSSVVSSASSDSVYNKQIKLQPGMNAFVNGELGTVRYVGRVDFSDGIWVGVHLKNQNGKNDGTVQGKKYFICKPGYGIMVKPSKVTIHGINASKLIDERDYPE